MSLIKLWNVSYFIFVTTRYGMFLACPTPTVNRGDALKEIKTVCYVMSPEQERKHHYIHGTLHLWNAECGLPKKRNVGIDVSTLWTASHLSQFYHTYNQGQETRPLGTWDL